MLPQWVIEKKRDGLPLSEDEITYFVGGYSRGTIPDYQMSALAMAILLRGMTIEETAALTKVMLLSGELVDTTSISLPKIDKHSTGGIGDKISLILAPLAACCGIAVPMISGRGLGITGGTLDKLESIPGYRTGITEKEFVQIINKCGCSIIGQTERLVPADRKLYALRDVTGTVPSIPLIVASIMSKKLAAGLDGLVLDVKSGRGAFMKTETDARALATALLDVARHMNKTATALITDMNQPLGHTAGNALEVVEAIETLKGSGPDDVTEVTLALCARMLILAKVCRSEAEALSMLRRKLASGEAFAKFVEMVALHNGDTSYVEDPSRFPMAAHRIPVTAPDDGTVADVNPDSIGRACLLLGAGRTSVTDKVNHAVGISGIAKVGQVVSRGEPIAVIHASSTESLATATTLVERAFIIRSGAAKPTKLILRLM
ncbi:MAG: thymidine phosphorylase [bacterium]